MKLISDIQDTIIPLLTSPIHHMIIFMISTRITCDITLKYQFLGVCLRRTIWNQLDLNDAFDIVIIDIMIIEELFLDLIYVLYEQ